VRIRAATEALPFESPKLTAVAHAPLTGKDFATLLDKAIARTLAGIPASAKLIEGRAERVEEEER
jgi:hypothetical protein